MPIELRAEHREAVDVFLLAAKQIRYTGMGQRLGLDLAVVIEIVKLMGCANPVKTIEKVMVLSKEFVEPNPTETMNSGVRK